MVLSFYALSGHYGDLRAQIGSAATWSFLLRAPHGVRRTHADEHEHRGRFTCGTNERTGQYPIPWWLVKVFNRLLQVMGHTLRGI